MRKLTGCLLALGLGVLAPGVRAEELKRVAVLDFGLVGAPGSNEAVTLDFSRAVQARLLTDPNYAWVERQEFERISRETDISGTGGSDPATAIRLGSLAQADLLLRGEIGPVAGGSGELKLEVVDLKRAEVLAVRVVPVGLNQRRRLQVSAAEVAAAGIEAREALDEARQALLRVQTVIAPLYFKNISDTERAGFIVERLQQALVKSATPASGIRVLQFPRAGEAGEESSLVLAGLTDTKPDAWQRVADAYVWGTIKETNVNGAEFGEVPVTINLQVLGQAGGLREVAWTGPVKSLDSGLAELTRGVQEAAKAGRSTAGDPVERQKIAAELRQRAADIGRGIQQESIRHRPGVAMDYRHSTPGRQLFAYQLRLLETASFFDPLNAALQKERLDAAWLSNPTQPLGTLRGQWLRVADYEAQARRFGHKADGTPDPAWGRLRAKNLAELVEALERAPWTEKAGKTAPEEIQRQRRAAKLHWLEVVTDPKLRAAATDEDNSATMQELVKFVEDDADLVTVRTLVDRALPGLPKLVGRYLKDPARVTDTQRFIDNLYTVYDAFGEYDRLKKMLDTAWAVGVPPLPATATARPPATKPIEQPWKQAGMVMPPAAPNPAAMAWPALEASVHEINVWPTTAYFEISRNGDGLQQEPGGLIDALAWHDGRLWVAQTGRPLPSEEGPANPQGGSHLWAYDPALHTHEYLTPGLGGHSPVRDLLPVGQALWLALDADGVIQRADMNAAWQRFRTQDGLMSPRMIAARAQGGDLFFLGGTAPNYSISRYTLASGRWQGIQLPAGAAAPPPAVTGGYFGNLAGTSAPPQLAVCGDWLCVTTPTASFYNLATNRWSDVTPTPAAAASTPAIPVGYTLVSADEDGFWLGRFGGLMFFRPQAPAERKVIILAGTPLAAAHQGPWLWVLWNDSEGGTRLSLIDKRTATGGGTLVLPRVRLTKILATDDRLWLGGSRLLEVNLKIPRPSGREPAATENAKTDLLHVVWRGDAAQVDALLAGKADVNAVSPSGWSALMVAVQAGRKDLAEKLLASGAKPDLLTKNGKTALQLAVAGGDTDLADLLLQRGAGADCRMPVRLVGLPPMRQLVEDLTPPSANRYAPRQPAGLKAAPTADGGVELTWQEQDNRPDVRYQITRNNMVIADLPPGVSRFTDRRPPWGEKEATYSVMAWNVSVPFDPAGLPVLPGGKYFPELKVPVLAAPPAHVVRLPDTFGAGSAPVVLPLRVTARPVLNVAAAAGRDDIIRRLIAAKADLNATDSIGDTPLIAAVRAGKYAAARQLLAAGAKAAAQNDLAETAASIAYQRHEDENFFRELMAKLSDAARTQEASTLMLEAAGRGQIKDLELLRSLGGKIDGFTFGAESTLSRAIASDKEATVLWLLDQGFVLHQRIRQSGEPMQTDGRIWEAAVRNNRPAIIKRLLAAGCDPNQKVNGVPLVVLAAQLKSFSTLEILRDAGADMKRPTTDGKTIAAFLSAAEAKPFLGDTTQGSWPVPRGKWSHATDWAMVAAGADPAKKAPTEQLIAASKAGDIAGVLAAIHAGAELDRHGDDGLNALHQALIEQKTEVARRLIAEGASIHVVSRGGNTPLNFATQNGQQMEMIEYLLSLGADPNACGYNGYPALYAAVASSNHAGLKRLLQTTAEVNLHGHNNLDRLVSPLDLALLKGNEMSVSLLLAAGANSRAQTYTFTRLEDGSERQEAEPSALMYAAAGKNLALVKQMISLGQNPKLKISGDYDALAWAADAGARDVVEYLLPLAEPKGRALGVAQEKGYNAIVQMLEKAGYQSP